MAERNPRIPHSVESLLFVNRNGKYCGYKLELISDNIGADLREFLICAICSGISRKPRNWGGNRVCEICFPEHSMRKINKRAECKVALLNARCPLSEEGCSWEGRLGEIEGHMEECLKLRVERQLECGIPIERGTNEQDNGEVRPLKMKRCDYCNQEVKANEENRHKEKCQYHPDTEVPCPYKDIGCEEIVQYTLANPNRGVPTQKIFVRISEVIHLYGRRNVRSCTKYKYTSIHVQYTLANSNLSNPNRTFLRMYSNIPVTIEKINLF